jgi:hypothetical protein
VVEKTNPLLNLVLNKLNILRKTLRLTTPKLKYFSPRTSAIKKDDLTPEFAARPELKPDPTAGVYGSPLPNFKMVLKEISSG